MAETEDNLERRLSADANLTPVARHIAQFIRENREFVLTATAAAIGLKAGASDATVLRTIRTLGFSGIADLKRTILESAGSTSSSADDMRNTLANLKAGRSNALDLVMQAHRESFEVLQGEECRSQISTAVKTLDAASRIVIFATGPAVSIAGYISYLLARSGRRTRTLDVTGAMLANQLLDLRRGDALLILAYGRLYREVSTVFAEAKRLRLQTVLVTEADGTPLAKQANTVIAIPRGRPGQIALHGATMVGLEALAFGLAAAKPDQTLRALDRLKELRDTIDWARRGRN